MPPLKSKGKGNGTKQKAELKRKSAEKCERSGSKASSQIPDEQQNKSGHSSVAKNKRSDERKTSKIKNTSKVDESKKKDLELQEKQKPTVKGKNRRSQPQSKEQSQNTQSMMKKRSKCSAKTPDHKQRTKNKSGGTESEEDQLENDPVSSAEATEGETSNQEEEQGSDRESDETQMSESSLEEAPASNVQSETEQTEPKKSETKKPKSKRGLPELQPGGTEGSEEEEDERQEAEASKMVSDGDEEHETTEEDTNEVSAPRTRGKQNKLKKLKADKQAKKAEEQRAKLEKQKLKKEAKEKAKEEKIQKKMQVKGVKPVAKKVQPPKDLHNDNDENEEEVEAAGTQNRVIKDQNAVLSLQGKSKHTEAVKEQDSGDALKGKPHSLFSKFKMASSGEQAGKLLTNIDKEPSEHEDSEAVSSQSKEQLISRRESITAIRRVSGWIQKKIPREFNLRKKLSALTKAIGISRWLSFRATKQKQATKISKGNIFKHKTAMKIASKTSLVSKKNKRSSEDKLSHEEHNLHQREEEEGAAATDKETEAKYAIVLPRVNKLDKLKKMKTTQAALGPLPASQLSGEPLTSEPKPPKPGAKLVLPVKPDLLILKSLKKPSGKIPTSDRDVLGRISDSHGSSEISTNLEDRKKRDEVEHPSTINVLQAARGKLKPSQVNLTKMAGKTISSQPTRLKEPDIVRERGAAIPRFSSKALHGGDSEAVPGGPSLYEEEADREVAQLMGDCGLHPITQAEVHWSGKCWMSGDPQV